MGIKEHGHDVSFSSLIGSAENETYGFFLRASFFPSVIEDRQSFAQDCERRAVVLPPSGRVSISAERSQEASGRMNGIDFRLSEGYVVQLR